MTPLVVRGEIRGMAIKRSSGSAAPAKLGGQEQRGRQENTSVVQDAVQHA
jgi:hypothetical protein